MLAKKCFPGACGTQDQRVRDIPIVQIEEIRRRMICFEHSKVLRVLVFVPPLAGENGE